MGRDRDWGYYPKVHVVGVVNGGSEEDFRRGGCRGILAHGLNEKNPAIMYIILLSSSTTTPMGYAYHAYSNSTTALRYLSLSLQGGQLT